MCEKSHCLNHHTGEGGDLPALVGSNQNQRPSGSSATTMAVNNDNFLDGPDPQLPLSSLRLVVPPLRLMSACMWRVAQQRNVQQYGKLAEFITLVTEMVPELLTPMQTAELVLGLRARLILELLQTEKGLDSKAIKEHLSCIQLLTTKDAQEEFPDGGLGVSKMAFVELVQTFTEKKSVRQKDHFFQKVFPEHYGLRFDTTLQILVWEFLSRLEEILPVSSFVEVASNPDLDFLDPKLEEFGSDTEDLRTLFQHPPKGSLKLEKNNSRPMSSKTDALNQSGKRCPDWFGESILPVNHRSTVILSSLASKVTSLTTDDAFKEEESDGRNSQPPITQLQEDSSQLDSSSGHNDQPSDQVEPGHDLPAEVVVLVDDDGDGDGHSDGSSSQGSIDDGRTHSCPQCDLTFARWPDLLGHQCPGAGVAAPGPRPVPRGRGVAAFQCDRCPKRLVSRSGLQKHLRAHLREAEPIVCPQCGKVFKHRSSLKVHLHRHTGARPFPCPACGKAFKEKSVLKTHLRVHSSDQAHLCSECGRGFRNLFSYVVHARMHTGEKPFLCDFCARRFITSERLKEHRRVHTGERPYPCEHCDKRFATNALLKRHVRVHTGEKPHRCPYCDKGFTQQSNMKIHLRVHRHDKAGKKR